jgi:hypothetical protein
MPKIKFYGDRDLYYLTLSFFNRDVEMVSEIAQTNRLNKH